LCAGLGWYSTRLEPYAPRLRKRSLRLPSGWPDLEILHLSDLHLRQSDPSLLRAQQRVFERLDHQPDLVCLTGDSCERVSDVPMIVELLRPLRPRLGVFAILGNHEYGADSPVREPGQGRMLARILGTIYRPFLSAGREEGVAIADALGQFGLCVLRNRGVRLTVGERSLWVAGVDDGWAMLADVEAAMRGKRDGEATLALIHEPELAFAAIERGADLVLAGHTHGGQVCLPGYGPLYWHRLDERLTTPAGVQHIGQAQLHISAGLGQLLPIRFRCPPELTLLHCTPSPSPSGRGPG
jgi:predicted MPP superfamily phosphohydrolase